MNVFFRCRSTCWEVAGEGGVAALGLGNEGAVPPGELGPMDAGWWAVFLLTAVSSSKAGAMLHYFLESPKLQGGILGP